MNAVYLRTHKLHYGRRVYVGGSQYRDGQGRDEAGALPVETQRLDVAGRQKTIAEADELERLKQKVEGVYPNSDTPSRH
jgi:hypothetical protein